MCIYDRRCSNDPIFHYLQTCIVHARRCKHSSYKSLASMSVIPSERNKYYEELSKATTLMSYVEEETDCLVEAINILMKELQIDTAISDMVYVFLKCIC